MALKNRRKNCYEGSNQIRETSVQDKKITWEITLDKSFLVSHEDKLVCVVEVHWDLQDSHSCCNKNSPVLYEIGFLIWSTCWANTFTSLSSHCDFIPTYSIYVLFVPPFFISSPWQSGKWKGSEEFGSGVLFLLLFEVINFC